MTAARKIAKLESLLARIDARRRPLESIGSAAVAAAPAPLRPEPPALDPVPDTPPGAVVSASQQPRSRTPMEQALSVELEVEETVVEIDYGDDDDGPIITIEPGPREEPEDDLDGIPTAPVGTPAVSRAAEPAVPPRAEPLRIETPVAHASSPVAKVVSRPAPRTFGELLDRTLALRPR